MRIALASSPSPCPGPPGNPAGECVPLEMCPHFRGWYVQASMELGPEVWQP